MFEKYGFLDLFCGIRKYFLCMIGVSVLGFLIGAYQGIVSGNENTEAVKTTYIRSDSFYFMPDKTDLVNENGVDYLKQVSLSTRAYILSDFSRKYVFDYLDKTYGRDNMMELLRKQNSESEEENYDQSYLSQFIHCNILSDNMTVNFWIESANEELTDVLFEGYARYVQYLDEDIFEELLLVNLGGAKQQKVENTVEKAADNGFRIGLILMISVFALSVMAVFLYSLFVPVMNRKTDFCEYEVNVSGEVLLKGNGQNKEIVNRQQYLRILNRINEDHVITITSSLKNEKYVKGVFERLKCEADDTYVFLEFNGDTMNYHEWYAKNVTDGEKKYMIRIPSIVVYETALQIAKMSDVCMLVEAYGKTGYKEFERTLELINMSQIHLEGVICLK